MQRYDEDVGGSEAKAVELLEEEPRVKTVSPTLQRVTLAEVYFTRPRPRICTKLERLAHRG